MMIYPCFSGISSFINGFYHNLSFRALLIVEPDKCHPNLGVFIVAGITREKIVTAVAREFICIADESKLVHTLGAFPLPVEVIPMARGHVARELVKLGGDPVYRDGVITDNGNIILDVYNFTIPQPLATEAKINGITGVVTNGLFALKPADVLFLGTAGGVKVLYPE